MLNNVMARTPRKPAENYVFNKIDAALGLPVGTSNTYPNPVFDSKVDAYRTSPTPERELGDNKRAMFDRMLPTLQGRLDRYEAGKKALKKATPAWDEELFDFDAAAAPSPEHSTSVKTPEVLQKQNNPFTSFSQSPPKHTSQPATSYSGSLPIPIHSKTKSHEMDYGDNLDFKEGMSFSDYLGTGGFPIDQKNHEAGNSFSSQTQHLNDLSLHSASGSFSTSALQKRKFVTPSELHEGSSGSDLESETEQTTTKPAKKVRKSASVASLTVITPENVDAYDAEILKLFEPLKSSGKSKSEAGKARTANKSRLKMKLEKRLRFANIDPETLRPTNVPTVPHPQGSDKKDKHRLNEQASRTRRTQYFDALKEKFRSLVPQKESSITEPPVANS
jgi:hypothetical protein